MRELPAKTAFFFIALPAVARAALRLTRLSEGLDLRQLADRLRAVEPWRGSYLANPRYLDATVSRLIKLLPPRRFGPCMKRSFLLLDLWSRCGLTPRVHLGTRKHGAEQQFHAWVTVPGRHEAAPDYAEIWSY